jgi:hypothetical protein
MTTTVQTIAHEIYKALDARKNCIRFGGNGDWQSRWEAHLQRIARELLPSGSGVDSGTRIGELSGNGFTLTFSYHHMNSDGFYTGWTDHKVTVRPGFYGLEVSVSGRDKGDGFKHQLSEIYRHTLMSEMPAGWNA